MKNIRAFLSVVLAVSGTCAFAAKDFYVSEDKSYGSDLVPPEQLFDDLQTAIDAAAKGDTVWVKDGFVCDTGSTKHTSLGRGESRICLEKAITLRGESGDWRTGPIIRGKYDTTADGRGDNAIRCLYDYNATGSRVIGFRLVDGASLASGNGRGGGAVWAYNGGTIENCLISNCVATVGGGTFQISLKGCTVVDCIATGVWDSYGGGAYGTSGCTATDCVFAGNKSDARGGGTYMMTLANCVVTNNTSGSGGGVYGGTSLTNCQVVCNTASTGAGVVGSTAYDCDICGNIASTTCGGIYQGNSWKSRICGNKSTGGKGGGVYQGWHVDGVISNNTSLAGGGGCYCVTATNCTIVSNRTAGGWQACGGGGYGGTYVNCRIVGNEGWQGGGGLGSTDATTALVAEDCWIEGNYATNSYGGGGVLGIASTRIEGCVVTNNMAQNTNGGGILSAGLVADSIIVGNSVANKSGGGVASCLVVSNCWIAGNAASSGGGASGSTLTHCVLTNNTCTYRGCGFHTCTLYNCSVVGNRKGVSSAAAGGGWDGSAYNCLVANNDNIGFQCWDAVSELVNCTLTGNEAGGFSTAAANKLRAVNVISWGNGTTADKATLVSSNCCLAAKSTVPEGSFNVFSADPRLTPDENGNLVPKSARCRNHGTVFDWMTDPSDVRSKDLAGNDRILGSAPDFGCFESKIYGLLVLIR